MSRPTSRLRFRSSFKPPTSTVDHSPWYWLHGSCTDFGLCSSCGFPTVLSGGAEVEILSPDQCCQLYKLHSGSPTTAALPSTFQSSSDRVSDCHSCDFLQSLQDSREILIFPQHQLICIKTKCGLRCRHGYVLPCCHLQNQLEVFVHQA